VSEITDEQWIGRYWDILNGAIIFDDYLPVGHEPITTMMDYQHGKWVWLSALDETPTDIDLEFYEYYVEGEGE
jgi:hypothetical protein